MSLCKLPPTPAPPGSSENKALSTQKRNIKILLESEDKGIVSLWVFIHRFHRNVALQMINMVFFPLDSLVFLSENQDNGQLSLVMRRNKEQYFYLIYKDSFKIFEP